MFFSKSVSAGYVILEYFPATYFKDKNDSTSLTKGMASNYIDVTKWDVITNPCSNFSVIDVMVSMSNYIPYETMDVITCPGPLLLTSKH